MRCEEAENDIAEYLAGTLPEDSEFLNHLVVCARCRNEVQELKSMWNELAHVPVPQSSSVMQERLLATVAQIRRRTRMPYMLKPILLIITGLSAALYMGRSLALRSPEPEPAIHAERAVASNSNGHYRGESTAPITLLEYGDYACPCAFYNSIVIEVLERYPGKVRLEFRHFPLMGIHPNALKAAIAAEAAGEQGHFWEMHDLLFFSQQQWKSAENPEKEFGALATSIGIDSGRLIQTLQKPELQQRVMNDVAIGKDANIQAVPTFFINGKKVPQPPTTIEQFVSLIDAELQLQK